MPFTIACRECHNQMTVAENMVGKTVRCPHCQVSFVAVAANADSPRLVLAIEPLPQKLPPGDDEDARLDNIRRAPASANEVGLEKVKSALYMIYGCSVVFTFLVGVFLALAGLTSCSGAGLENSQAQNVLILGWTVLASTFGLVILMAQRDARQVLAETGARGYIVACCLLVVAFLFLNCGRVWHFLSQERMWRRDEILDSPFAQPGLFLEVCMVLAATIFFVLFLRAIALYMGSADLAKSCRNFLVFFVATWVLIAGMTTTLLNLDNLVVAGLFQPRTIKILAEFLFFMTAGALVLTASFWFVSLVGRVHDLIEKMVPTPGRR